MAWEDDLFALFDDLEQQAEAMYGADRDAELADRSRAEYAQVTLAGRLMASVGLPVSLQVRGVGRVEGSLDRVGRGWCLVAGPGQDWLVPDHAVLVVEGASPRAVPEPAWPAVSRLGLGSALRRLAEAGERCVVHLVDGTSYDVVPGRVGADFVEAADGAARTLLLALDRVGAIQRRD